MPGTLTIGTLSDGTNSTSATNCISGSAKAWVNFNGVTTATTRASYNVSSVTRNGTGDYTVNFTNALTDANYVVVSTGGTYITSAGSYGYGLGVLLTNATTYTAKTTSAVRLTEAQQALGSVADLFDVNIAIFR